MTTATTENTQTQPVQATDADAVPKKSRARPFLILAAVMALALGTYGAERYLTKDLEGTDDAQVRSDVVPIAARVSGTVQRLVVQPNQVVKRGEPLLIVDDAEFAAKVKQAEAELETARAQAAAADAQVQVVAATAKGGLSSATAAVSANAATASQAAANVAQAQASIAHAQADATRTKTDLDRVQKLHTANAVAEADLDRAGTANDAAQAALVAAKAQLAAAEEARNAARSHVVEARGRLVESTPTESKIAVATAEAALALARVKSAEAALDLRRLDLAYTKINAPTDGQVSELSVHEGQLISIGQTLAMLVPRATYIVANFKETQIGRMRVGQPVEVDVDAFPGRHFEAKVESLSAGTGAQFSLLPPDNASGNFVKVVQRVPVRIAWENLPADVPMRAGLSADVTVRLQ
jgi:membrane fusion protein (multidrug efflux system)